MGLQEAEAELSSSIEPSVQPLLDAIVTTADKDLSEAQRLFHGRGGCYPGAEHLTLDWFPPVWVLTSFQELNPSELQLVGGALEKQWLSMLAVSDKSNKLQNNEQLFGSEFIWVYQCRCQNNVTTTLMSGSLPEPHIVQENGCQYLVQVGPKDSSGGRNMGLFLDMRNGRQWIQENAKNKKVLNMFAYTCAFSVAALKGGAKEVVNIDMAKGALKLGQRNHELNGFETGGARFLGHNVFKTFGKLKKLGPYDIVVADPPSYQKGSFVAKKDYAKLIRRIPDLLAANYGGSTGSSYALLCLNAPELDTDFLKQQVAEVAPDLSFVEQLDNPPTFPAIDPERALKVLVYEMKPKQ